MSGEELFFCPLECGARIKSLKHINKCKNGNLLGVKYKLCEYNPTHIIKNELYQIHLLSCNSKKKYEEDKKESFDDDDDDLSGKFSDASDDENENKEIKKDEKNEKDTNENDNEENNINKRKRRYKHERALYKDEQEIEKECLDFFNKVYI